MRVYLHSVLSRVCINGKVFGTFDKNSKSGAAEWPSVNLCEGQSKMTAPKIKVLLTPSAVKVELRANAAEVLCFIYLNTVQFPLLLYRLLFHIDLYVNVILSF